MFSILILLLVANVSFVSSKTVVILGEPACAQQDYLEHARQPGRVMHTVMQAWYDIIHHLEQYGVMTVVTSRENYSSYPSADLFIFWDYPFGIDEEFLAQRMDRSCIVLNEPTSVIPEQYNPQVLSKFRAIFTWNDNLVQRYGYIKYTYPVAKPYKGELSFAQRKLACMICHNKWSGQIHEMYSTRRAIITFFNEQYPQCFDLYGGQWYPSPVYKGTIPDKLSCLQNYRFNFCLENTRHAPGYITEKIFDAMEAGAIPIYAGPDNSDEYIPRNCYIDYTSFQSLPELVKFLQAFTQETYLEYQHNIKRFLESEQAQKFMIPAFVQLFTRHLCQLLDLPPCLSR